MKIIITALAAVAAIAVATSDTSAQTPAPVPTACVGSSVPPLVVIACGPVVQNPFASAVPTVVPSASPTFQPSPTPAPSISAQPTPSPVPNRTASPVPTIAPNPTIDVYTSGDSTISSSVGVAGNVVTIVLTKTTIGIASVGIAVGGRTVASATETANGKTTLLAASSAIYVPMSASPTTVVITLK